MDDPRRQLDPLTIWRSIAGPQPGLFISSAISVDQAPRGPWFQVYLRASDLGPLHPPTAFEELLESAGSMNVVGTLALINNYLTTVDPTPETHNPLLQFLSDVRHEQLREYETRHKVESPHTRVIFSRVACLAAIKLLLLGRDRWPTESDTSPNVVGEFVLLTNDLLKGEDAKGSVTDESLLLEFLTNWDISNTADIALSMARGDRLIRDHLQGDEPRIVALREALSLDTETFDGCTLEEHQTLTFSIYSVMSHAVAEKGSSSLQESSVAESLLIDSERVSGFFAAHSQNAEAFSQELATSLGSTSIHEASRRPEFLMDARSVRSRPFLRRDADRHLLLDLDCVVDLSAGGLYWHLYRSVSPEQSSALPVLWGYVFERYCRALLDHFYPAASAMLHHEVGYAEDGKSIAVEAVLNLHSVVILFEFKASKFRTEEIRSRDEPRVDTHLASKFIGTASRGRGGGQLARDAEAIVRGKLRHIGHHPDTYVFPVLVTEEPLIASLGVNERLNDKFRARLSGENAPRIRPLTTMSIEELEFLLPYVSRGTPSWQYLLGSRFKGDCVRPTSVYQALWDIRRRENLPTYQNDYLMRRWEEVFAHIVPFVKKDESPIIDPT